MEDKEVVDLLKKYQYRSSSDLMDVFIEGYKMGMDTAIKYFNNIKV